MNPAAGIPRLRPAQLGRRLAGAVRRRGDGAAPGLRVGPVPGRRGAQVAPRSSRGSERSELGLGGFGDPPKAQRPQRGG